MSDATDEHAWMLAYLAGDQRAFEQLFRRFAPKVYGFFLRAFGDDTTAHELMQTTFFNMHRSRMTYRSDMPVRPWVFTIAAHVRRDELRRRYRRKEDGDESALMEAENMQARQLTSSYDDSQQERVARVRAAIDRLPESQRTIVQLHRYEGFTFEQIAALLGSTPVAVRGRAFRAYERLRVELAELVQG